MTMRMTIDPLSMVMAWSRPRRDSRTLPLDHLEREHRRSNVPRLVRQNDSTLVFEPVHAGRRFLAHRLGVFRSE